MLRNRLFVLIALFTLAAVVANSYDGKPAGEANKGGKVSFSKQVQPVLQANCYGCHQPAKAKGNYQMTSRKGLLQGGESGSPAVVPGKPEKSHVLEMITPQGGKAEMPQGRPPLAAGDIELIRRWISEGAEDDSPKSNRPTLDGDHPPIYSHGAGGHVAGFFARRHAAGRGRLPRGDSLEGGRLGARRAAGGHVRPHRDRPLLRATARSCWSWAAIPAASARSRCGTLPRTSCWARAPVGFDTLYGGSWSPDGKLIAVGGADNALRAFDAENFQQVVYMAAHDDWIRGTVFSGDGKSLFTASRDMTVKMTDVATQRFVGNLTTHTPGILRGGMQAIDRHPKRNEVIVGGADGAPKLFKMDVQAAPAGGGNPNQIREYEAMPGRIYRRTLQCRRHAVLRRQQLDGHGQVRSYETDNGKLAWQLDVPEAAIYAVACSPDGATLAAAGADGQLRLIDAATGTVRKTFLPVEITPPPREAGRLVRRSRPFRAPGTPGRGDEHPAIADDRLRPAGSRAFGNSHRQADRLRATALHGAHCPVEPGRTSRAWSGGRSKARSGRFRERDDSRRCKAGRAGSSANLPGSTWKSPSKSPPASTATCPASCATWSRSSRGWAATRAPATARPRARTASSSRSAATIRCSITARLTDDLASRRINTASPDDSLMLLKPTAAVPHQGGQVFTPDTPYYRTLRRWIAEGAKLDLSAPRVTKIAVFPKDPVIERIGGSQQMRVVATYADATTRDVTREAFIESGNTEVATADRQGVRHRGPPRRGPGAGPLRRRLRGHHAHRDGRPQRLRLADSRRPGARSTNWSPPSGSG